MSKKEVDELRPLLKTKTLLKDEILLGENETCNFLTFIKKGTFRSFHVNSNGKFTNLMLNSEFEFISDYESYLSGLPATISIQAIKTFEVILIAKKELNELLETSFALK